MTIMEAMKARHSVRRYLDKPLTEDMVHALQAEISACNAESGLHIQLATNEPKAFGGTMARYGSFGGVTSYIAMVGRDDADLDEKCGYYGERIVLKAQQLGLNTCWVALTYKKVPSAYEIRSGEKLAIVISIGYGADQGVPHKSKTVEAVSKSDGTVPAWFRSGMEAALLAPTAVNQQKFMFYYRNGKVEPKAGVGFYANIDLGIVKYHFEIGAGKENFAWG